MTNVDGLNMERMVYMPLYIQSESVNLDIVYPTNQPSYILLPMTNLAPIINDSLIRQNRVPRSDSDTSFRQQNVTFQSKMTSIIRKHENVAKYLRWFSHARHTDMLSVMAK